MSEDSKTYVFNPDSNNSMLWAAMNNNGGFGGNNMWNNPIWALVFLAVLGGNGFGFGNNRGNANTDFVGSQLGQAIAGNANAISNLATQLNCTEGQIQSTINTMMNGINGVSNTIGMSSQNIINAVNSGNNALASQICECCCNMKQLVTESNYQNQIATLNQTNQLGSKIDNNTNAITAQLSAQTTFLSDKFCDLEKRELQNKIDALRERNTQLASQIDNANQTAQISAYVSSVVNPLAGAVNALQNDINGIKCKLPETVTVNANNGVYVPACAAANLGLFGNLGNNSLWL